jgi:uncharacterized cupin superfamily protein
MASIDVKSLSTPEETRTLEKTKVEVVNVGGTEVGRFTLQPGWRWSECIKPVVKTESCQAEHLGYVLSGSMHVVQQDGTEADVRAGEAYRIAPGHDAWVLGNEPYVALEFKSAGSYAKA